MHQRHYEITYGPLTRKATEQPNSCNRKGRRSCQKNRKIQNPATQVPKTPQMNDRDITNDMLATEKYLTSSYTTALHEASHQHLYDDLLKIFNETQQAQRELFLLMFQNGWYSLEAENEQKIQQSGQHEVIPLNFLIQMVAPYNKWLKSKPYQS